MINGLKEVSVNFERLLLDPNNPRFAKNYKELVLEEDYDAAQAETYKKMLSFENNFEVPELADNIKTNGFLAFDRMFVKKAGKNYLVIEGNRRVAAVKFMLDKYEGSSNSVGEHVKKTLINIPCIDLTGWDEEEVNKLLGLRHYDSVKDWRPLPASFNLFKTYMKEFFKRHDREATDEDDYCKSFKFNSKINKIVADIYAIRDANAKSMILTYRLYSQLRDSYDSLEFDDTENIFSALKETIGKPILRKRFGFDQERGVFNEEGLEMFVDLIFGLNGKRPVITSISAGESTLRDYAYVLEKGNEEDVLKIEEQRDPASEIKGIVKARVYQDNLKNTLENIMIELGKINFKQITQEDITDREVEIIKHIEKMVVSLKGASGNKFK